MNKNGDGTNEQNWIHTQKVNLFHNRTCMHFGFSRYITQKSLHTAAQILNSQVVLTHTKASSQQVFYTQKVDTLYAQVEWHLWPSKFATTGWQFVCPTAYNTY
jgi:hypothetical protein